MIWKLGEPITLICPHGPGHNWRASTVAFNPAGQTLASGGMSRKTDGSGLFGEVKLWEAATGNYLETLLNQDTEVASIAFNPNGESLLVADVSGSVVLLDLRSGEVLRRFLGPRGTVTSASFNSGGDLVGASTVEGKVYVWEASSGKTGPSRGEVYEIAFSPDGRHLASANRSGTVYVLKLSPGQKPPAE